MAPASAAGVDVGGTFTDVVVVAADGRPVARKVATTPHDQSVALADGLAAAAPEGVARVAHGTTTATNAVLERRTARTVLVATQGFRDVLEIGRQDRPSLYDLRRVRAAPLVPRDDVVVVAERTASDGEPVVTLTDAEVEQVVTAVAARRPESVALSLLFSWAGPAHEERLEAALARLGVPVTCSSALVPELREYERASTCVLNAAVAPVMSRYLKRVRDRLPGVQVSVMASGGGTLSLQAAAEAPVATLLSGPAAGVVAAAAAARAAGYDDAVAFDMGGTSTDVCLIRGGRPEPAADASIAGLPFRTAALAIHTVGAGGGSIAAVDTGGALAVGPRSAGAVPGPACYGRGGVEPTVTDAHLALGHLEDGALLGEEAHRPVRLARAAADAALRNLVQCGAADGVGGAAEGVLAVVRATMVRALRRVTTERGVDPRHLALVAYGGAGPLSATALARSLGCAAVVVPPVPGVLSALGLLLAPPRVDVARTVLGAAGDTEPVWVALEQAARTALAAQGAGAAVRVDRAADVRYAGQSHELRIDARAGTDLARAFGAAHELAYGYALPGAPVEIVTLRVAAEAAPALSSLPSAWDLGPARPERRRRVRVDGAEAEVAVHDRSALRPGEVLAGPALVVQPDTTTLLGPGDAARVDDASNLVVELTS